MQIKVNRQNTTVLQIPLRNFYQYLNITEDPKESHETTNHPNEDGEERQTVCNETSDFKAPAVNVPPSSGTRFSQVASVIASLNDGIIVPDSSANLHDLLMDSMTGEDR